MFDGMIAIIMDWQANSPFLFAVTVIVVMALEGLILGILADFLFKLLGIRVRKVNR